jgi:hypothetical protein
MEYSTVRGVPGAPPELVAVTADEKPLARSGFAK